MSLYGEYIKERENYEIFETEGGFATYCINASECYIRDIYVKPEFRRSGFAKVFAKRIEETAKEKGATTLLGTVCVGMHGDTDSLKVLLAYGFKLSGVFDKMIYFTKEIS